MMLVPNDDRQRLESVLLAVQALFPLFGPRLELMSSDDETHRTVAKREVCAATVRAAKALGTRVVRLCKRIIKLDRRMCHCPKRAVHLVSTWIAAPIQVAAMQNRSRSPIINVYLFRRLFSAA